MANDAVAEYKKEESAVVLSDRQLVLILNREINAQNVTWSL